MGRGWQSGVTASATALSTAAYPLRMPRRTQRRVLRCRVTTPLKEAMIALADALAKRPAEEIMFEWFRSGRLDGELSDLMKSRHPKVQAEMGRVYQEYLAELGKRRREPAAQED